jgi:hypothetical protein
MPAGSWVINIFTFWTVNLHSFGFGNIRKTNRKNWLSIAKNPRAASKVSLLVFLTLVEEEYREEYYKKRCGK